MATPVLPQLSPINYNAIDNDVYAHVGRQILTDAHFNPPSTVPPPMIPFAAGTATPRQWHEVPTKLPSQKPVTEQRPIGILGGGVGGLYTALILDAYGIPYRILEAQGHVGGRLFTYKFPNTTGGPYNYFDVGAMRFPHILIMKHFWALVHHLDLEDSMKPYYFTAKDNNAFLSYNNRTYRQNAVPTGVDAFDAKGLLGNKWKTYVDAGPKNIHNDVISPFAYELYQDLETGSSKGWRRLLEKDKYSSRAYMCTEYRPSKGLGLPDAALPTDVINWMETFAGSTGSFDRAFTQDVLDALAFGWLPNPSAKACFYHDDDPEVEWFLFDGGSEVLAKKMEQHIRSDHPQQSPIIFNQRVTSIKEAQTHMEVVARDTTSGEDTTYEFSHVITTLPLPILRSLDLSSAGLSTKQSNAIRQLSYSASIKVGMQFKTAWWTTAEVQNEQLNIVGGQSFTDRPVRRIVYPSYGSVKDGLTTTLIASYTVAEDADRMGALTIHGENGAKADPVLIDMVLRDLVAVHGVTMEFLQEQLIDTFAWNWGDNPYSMGAFAYFTPGNYGDLFKSLTTPAASGRLHFAGEAISMVHAWVEGALDSAWHAIAELLPSIGNDDLFGRFAQDWPIRAEWLSLDQVKDIPESGMPAKRADLLKNGLLYKHILLTEHEQVVYAP